jgi:bifunctional non-homologous end joining protein LigD
MARIVRRSTAQGATKRSPREATSRISEPPRWIEPQLCKLVDKAPSGPEWVYEVRLDGYWMAARIDHGDACTACFRTAEAARAAPFVAKAVDRGSSQG